jgi:hypothetical protein
MRDKGDIPERGEVKIPKGNAYGPEQRIQLVQSILDHGGTAHVYLNSVNRAPEEDEVEAEDIHVTAFNSHTFPEDGYLYALVGDDEFWIFGDDIGAIERHYE